MSNFAFLKSEWPEVFEAASKSEKLVYDDARTSCFYARRALELGVRWIYTHDRELTLPYQEHLAALIHEPKLRDMMGAAVFTKAKLIKDLGNLAVHSTKPIRQFDALTATKELFHVMFWQARTYARNGKPDDGLAFKPEHLKQRPEEHFSAGQTESGLLGTPPVRLRGERESTIRIQKLEADLKARDESLIEALTKKLETDAELQRLREAIAEAKKANTAQADNHDYSEAETRRLFIDLLLREAGWSLDQKRDREFGVDGMPNNEGKGYVDYVLWGDDGIPLALVEAKRTTKSPAIGQQQAKLYADCLEKRFGRRPLIFYTNGYEHWIWHDASYPPRPIQGFLKKAELELIIQRRASRKSLAAGTINKDIVERHYQTRAIRRIGESFEKDNTRKALVVMATGAGKTRTVIALCDLLMRCNWVKRVLFLADRIALVNQAVGAFKKHLPDSAPVNLVTDKDAEGRVFVSTYPTITGLIDDAKDGQRRFGVGHFDLVIIDEAHRSVYQKYKAIFAYFDSLLVGLTATPRDEIDRDTYGLFDLEKGVPTDVYDLKEAIADGFLVPPQAVSVPLRFLREGVRYDDLSDEEKEQWDEKEWTEDGTIPTQVDAEAFNKWLFNQDTVDKVLEHLMTRGQKVAGGDVLGKTIIFAKSQKHAEFIAERFDKNYPQYKGAFARVIHCDLPYAQSLIDEFSKPASQLNIAISVDMLDTGIDVPEVVNLVFFKMVRSKTKFWQMIGRGTRLCRDLFGPGKDKEFFYVFDYCQNLEFFSQNPEATEGSVGASLSKKLFTARLELITAIDNQYAAKVADVAEPDMELRLATANLLQTEVAAMNVNNFIVRPQRRLVEIYREPKAWSELKTEAVIELTKNVAGLPTELDAEDEEAKRFDLLILNLQLAMLRSEPSFARLAEQVQTIAGLLEEKSAIPMVQKQMVLIQEIQTSDWWKDSTLGMLESARKRLRDLVKLIDKVARKPVYTNFEDDMGAEVSVELPGVFSADNFAKFRIKALHFLKAHMDDLVIHKVRMNEPLTATDLAELERMLREAEVGSETEIAKAKEEAKGLGLFVRSLVGLDREAAKKAFAGFLEGKTLRANQIEFINLIIDHLSERGIIDAAVLYESPYTDLNPMGVDGIFSQPEADNIVSIIDEIRRRAEA